MRTIQIKELIEKNSPQFLAPYPAFVKNFIYFLLSRVLHIAEINSFLEKNQNVFGIDFIDELFDSLDFSYSVSKRDRDKIPSEGRVVIVANHPLGGLDGLALLKLVSEVRKDVRIVVNDALMHINNLENVFLPYSIFSPGMQRERIVRIHSVLQNEEAVIIFPAGEVSRIAISGVKDAQWTQGAYYFASKNKAPVLPIHVHARNSLFFYLFSMVAKKLSVFLLPHELFNKRKHTIRFTIGNPIPAKVFSEDVHRKEFTTKLLRKHLYQIAKGKKGVFLTEKNVIQSVDKLLIKKEIDSSELLGHTADGKSLHLICATQAVETLREISRLRELTFRKVGEGTGSKKDLDRFDHYYKHIVVWDNTNLDIVGSYRLGIGSEIFSTLGLNGFYTSTLFNLTEQFVEIAPISLELGRSFVQEKYWGTYALDYLWQGIGAYLKKNQEIRYLFGPVSLSNSYPEEAKAHILFYYKKWFTSREKLAQAKLPYILPLTKTLELNERFNGNTMKEDEKILKAVLKNFGVSIPVLYRQYSELCEEDGVKFVEYNIDPEFGNCVDAFIVVDLHKLRPQKRERYLQ